MRNTHSSRMFDKLQYYNLGMYIECLFLLNIHSSRMLINYNTISCMNKNPTHRCM